MIWINQLRRSLAKPRVAQPHRQATALDAAEKRLNEVYSLVIRLFDPGAVDPVRS
jgi:hypothetical protein